jgi:phosphatidylinositol alpha-1,6-mannosyltransferase
VYSYGEELAMLLRRRGLAWRLQRWALGGASTVFAISRFSGDIVLSFGVDPARVCVQFPGVSEIFFGKPTRSLGETKRSLGVAADAPVVLTATRLMERKGVDTVIRAMPRVLGVFPDTVYVVAGSGGDEARLRKLATSLGVERHVVFLGDTSHDDLLNYYHASDLFVMASREIGETGETDTFGVVFLEANACGKPVIGGRVRGVLDAIEDGESGLLVDPTDVDAVAAAIVRFLKDPEYARQVGERGRRRARERFSWDRNAAEVLQALTEAVRAARG